ncbi:hypothetical protein HD554DRAFT_2123695 [Boletus coccyginus]|nr:hypothetical protein HD554DRAFT_2123695 [Boletus coccyginus]
MISRVAAGARATACATRVCVCQTVPVQSTFRTLNTWVLRVVVTRCANTYRKFSMREPGVHKQLPNAMNKERAKRLQQVSESQLVGSRPGVPSRGCRCDYHLAQRSGAHQNIITSGRSWSLQGFRGCFPGHKDSVCCILPRDESDFGIVY